MTQAISGVSPGNVRETSIWTIWPSVARFSWACKLGQLYQNRFGIANILTIGNIWVAITLPIQLGAYFLKLLPGVCKTYRLTNRRVVVETLTASARFVEERSVSFDRFDSIELVELPGQSWYHSGDLVFREGAVETFRLSGVPSPGAFRRTCLEARNVAVGVKQAVGA